MKPTHAGGAELIRLHAGGYVSVGIEGTFEPASGRDTLVATGHFRGSRFEEDFGLVRALGVSAFRYPIPWQHIEVEPGTYRWRRMDRIIESACGVHGLSLIADPLHHTSYPRWLTGGFLDPRFPAAYVRFVREFASRYPMVRVFTPFNEPTCTLDFCGLRGFWHPYASEERAYVTMLRQTARAVAEVIQMLRAMHRDAYILHVDTFQRHEALDKASARRAAFLNQRRFLFEELITGCVGPGHPLHGYLLEHGFGREALAWHVEHPQRIDERGGNYYPLNEEQLQGGVTHHAPSTQPLGFAGVVREYARRLPYPLSLTETNIQGSVRDRISWLRYMLEQSEHLQAMGITLRRFAWYPLFDCAGWGSLLQARRWARDPQGIFTCGRDWTRVPNEFSDLYRQVAGGLRSAQLPAYRFGSMHDRTLRGLMPQMPWNWLDAAELSGRRVA